MQYKISVNELIPGPVQTSIDDNAKTSNSKVKSMESEWQKQPKDVVPLALFWQVNLILGQQLKALA
jgi:3-oxoacyl-[acyl-carrier protein] reductase